MSVNKIENMSAQKHRHRHQRLFGLQLLILSISSFTSVGHSLGCRTALLVAIGEHPGGLFFLTVVVKLSKVCELTAVISYTIWVPVR